MSTYLHIISNKTKVIKIFQNFNESNKARKKNNNNNKSNLIIKELIKKT